MSAEQKGFATKIRAASYQALGGGVAGALAMVAQTFTLMWMRTILNYQYRYGSTLQAAARALYADGGIARFYRGLWWALLQAPASRFGDTASNALLLATLRESSLPVSVKTFLASLVAGVWRILLNPIDSFKTSMQVDGTTKHLREKIRARGVLALYDGAAGTYVATAVGHFPWFVTNNYLNLYLPKASSPLGRLVRNAVLGWAAALVSDTVSNSVRVVKTTVQTSEERLTYRDAVKRILEEEGLHGLLFRGLGTKMIANGIQSMMFSVLWRYFEKLLMEKKPIAIRFSLPSIMRILFPLG
jgi:hypothetical protein